MNTSSSYFSARKSNRSLDLFPYEVAFGIPIRNAMTHTASTKHHSLREVRIENSVVYLANDRSEFRYAQRDSKFMIETPSYPDLEALIGTLYDIESIPSSRSGFVDFKFFFNEMIEGSFGVYCIEQ